MKFALFVILNELTFLQKIHSIGFGEKVNNLLNMVDVRHYGTTTVYVTRA